MEQVRLAPLVGIAGCLAVLGLLAYPYVVGDGGVGAYYGSGIVNPLMAGLLALVATIIFAAGREGRTDPGFAAGVGLVFGAFIVAMLLAWAGTARLDTIAISRWHRWITAGFAGLVPAGGLWFARALDII
ncbi:MAG: hypothetical protein V5A39_10360 [Haloarculaceae archaeon]